MRASGMSDPSIIEDENRTRLLKKLGLLRKNERIARKSRESITRRRCRYPGGCIHDAYEPSIFCQMHQRPHPNEALERLVGAVHSFIWHEESRRRRKLTRSRVTGDAWTEPYSMGAVPRATYAYHARGFPVGKSSLTASLCSIIDRRHSANGSPPQGIAHERPASSDSIHTYAGESRQRSGLRSFGG